MSAVTLWPFQRSAVDALRSALDSGRYLGRPEGPAIVLPTGTGKTETFARMAIEWLDDHPGTRVLALAHRTELVEQAYQKFVRATGDAELVGRVQGKHNKAGRRIVCASVPTLSGAGGLSRRKMIRDVSLVIADECHHAPSASWQEVMGHYAELGASFVGVTATMVRNDRLALGKTWPDVVYSKPISEAIAEGYLVQPRGIRVKISDLDLSGVKTTAGDFNARQLGAALGDSLAPAAIARAVRIHASDRKSVLFAPTKEVARLCHEALLAEGFTSEMLYDGMDPKERERIMRDAVAGRIDVVCNCMILTEGTDVPIWSCAVIVRPTQSVGLFVQMVGRVLRLHPSKTDGALVLDVTGRGVSHKLVSPIELFAEEAKMKIENDEAHLDELGDLVLDLLGEEDELLPDPGTAAEGRDGPLESENFDLFGASASAWACTRGGNWFLNLGERLVVIVRGTDPYAFSVVSIAAQGRGGRWIAQNLATRALAQAIAEADIAHHERALSRRGRKWRGDPVTPAQEAWLVRHGLLTETITRGQASELMDISKASDRIDPVVSSFYGGPV
jgi:superfamily II DNA or RNA helicase